MMHWCFSVIWRMFLSRWMDEQCQQGRDELPEDEIRRRLNGERKSASSSLRDCDGPKANCPLHTFRRKVGKGDDNLNSNAKSMPIMTAGKNS